jgi:hypothetical protein
MPTRPVVEIALHSLIYILLSLIRQFFLTENRISELVDHSNFSPSPWISFAGIRSLPGDLYLINVAITITTSISA